jgi:hypothetical protein
MLEAVGFEYLPDFYKACDRYCVFVYFVCFVLLLFRCFVLFCFVLFCFVWLGLFFTCFVNFRLLNNGGTVVVQVISTPEDRYETYRYSQINKNKQTTQKQKRRKKQTKAKMGNACKQTQK